MKSVTDYLVVGGGVTGLAVARELVARGATDVLVLEKEPEPGRHASGRNSGVLHAGVYYAPGSERALTCAAGARLMKAYCRERGLPLAETGKVIVARRPEELTTLHELHRRATANGANLRLVDEAELAAIEPNARTAGQALHSPDTAVVDPKAVLRSLRQELTDSGRCAFAFNTAFQGAAGRDRIRTSAGNISYGRLVNAAGAHADRVAAAFGLGRDYRLVPFKGVYRKLKKERASLIRGSVYPTPDPRNPFLGVHFTRSVHGDVYLGPTAIPAFGRENYGILSGLDGEAPAILALDAALFLRNRGFRSVALTEPRKYFRRPFFEDARQLVHALDIDDLEPSPKVGIRPQLVDMKRAALVMDFVLERGERSVHVLNAISPAFTSSFVFARRICDELAQVG